MDFMDGIKKTIQRALMGKISLDDLKEEKSIFYFELLYSLNFLDVIMKSRERFELTQWGIILSEYMGLTTKYRKPLLSFPKTIKVKK